MNYLDLLPEEVVDKIYYGFATKIQKRWQKHSGRKVVAAQLRDSLYEVYFPGMEPSVEIIDPHTSHIIDYSTKVLSGRESQTEREQWILFINRVQHELSYNEYMDGPGAIYYNHTEIAIRLLEAKLNV